MSSSVLVAFPTAYGSISVLAECIARVLRGNNSDVELALVQTVRAVDDHTFAAGASLTQRHTAIERRRFALFAFGPIGESPGDPGQLRSTLAAHPWSTPGEVALSGGRFDPSSLNFPDRLVTGLQSSPLYGVPASDAREWDAKEVAA